ncbi:MAG: hypothetical protein WCJ33_05940 [Pseudomonadota bacterium]
MIKSDSDNEIDLSEITQAAVGYVKEHADSKKMAEGFVAQVRVQLGHIIAHMDSGKQSPLGNKANPESIALMEYALQKMSNLKTEKGYAQAQASAIVLKDELVPLQVVAGMANDSEMIASVRKVNAHVISELGNVEAEIDPRSLLKRKKRGRAPGSGKKKEEK